MHYTQKGLSFLIVLTLCIQPVFAYDLISEADALLPETIAEPVVYDIPSQTPSKIIKGVPETEYISASVVTPAVEKTTMERGASLSESSSIAGEILVKFKDRKIDLTTSVGRSSASRIAKSASLKKTDELRESNIALFTITDASSVEEKIDELEAHPSVESVQPNFIYTPTEITTNDSSRELLWGLDNTGQNVNGIFGTQDTDVDAPEAWAINEGTNASVIVAVIDTGVAYNHPDLQANMWDGSNCKNENGQTIPGGCNHGYDYEENDVTPLPSYSSHGTHIAGTIAAVKNNTKGITGIAPSAKIMALKTSLTTGEIVKSIQFATHNDAQIINASWVGSFEDPLLKSAIAEFPGLFVAAAGNTATDNEASHIYPSDFDLPNIISVAATDQIDDLAYFSNYGATSVDVGAPGVNILSTVAEATALSESFEGVTPSTTPDGWIKGGDQNSWSTYSTGIPEWGNILSTDHGYPYKDNANTTITSPTVNLNVPLATIDFWTACDTEYVIGGGEDFMLLEYSADGINFTPLYWWDEASLDTDFNPNNNSIEGVSGGTLFHLQDLLIPAAYLTSNFRLQFRWVTDDIDNEHYGCAVDKIQITTISDGANEHYEYSNGTSMAAPHVAGLAALIKGYAPRLTPSQVKDMVLTTGDSLPSLLNKTVTGKRINAGNALRNVKSINTFDIPSQVGETTIDETAHTIVFTVPFGTDVTTLIPSITFAGSSTNPVSGIAQDFTAPVTYTITAHDGTTQDYVVTVQIAAEIITPPVISPPSSEGGGGGSSSGGGGGGGSKSKVQINSGAKETRTRDVQLTITRVKDATQMQISNTPDFTGLSWVRFANTYTWTLAPGNGNKTVYVRYGKNDKEVGKGKDTITLRESNGGLTAQALPQAPQGSTVGGTSRTPATQLKFVSTLSVGSQNQEVTDLQNILIAGKYLLITPATGYYGQVTARAVQAYQKAHGIPQTGIVDEATRTKLNGSVTTSSADAQRAALIKVLQAKLLELIGQLKAMQAR